MGRRVGAGPHPSAVAVGLAALIALIKQAPGPDEQHFARTALTRALDAADDKDGSPETVDACPPVEHTEQEIEEEGR